MRLSVNGRYVDLDMQVTPPLKLSCQYANNSVAVSAARRLCVLLGEPRCALAFADNVTDREQVVYLKRFSKAVKKGK